MINFFLSYLLIVHFKTYPEAGACSFIFTAVKLTPGIFRDMAENHWKNKWRKTTGFLFLNQIFTITGDETYYHLCSKKNIMNKFSLYHLILLTFNNGF